MIGPVEVVVLLSFVAFALFILYCVLWVIVRMIERIKK